jgi:membrane protein YdbS with pleckstrin-like domain
VTQVRRSPPRGPAVDSDDPTLQEIGIDATGSVAVQERTAGEPIEEPAKSFAERFTDWRRHYVPLPDEVVTEYLGEDEYVIHSDHPSFRAFLIKNSIQVLIATALLPVVFAFVRMDLEWWWILLIVLGLDLVLLVLAIRRLSDRYTSYVITNLRLIRVSGIIGRKLASIPWTRMTGLGYRQKPIGRLMGFATIFIESANEESGLREFSDINDPAAFHQLILDMVSSKGGPRPEQPTKGVRKTLRQRRRDAREAQKKRAVDQAAEARQAAVAPSEPVKVTDTAGAAEAMSTTDALGAPSSAPKTATATPAVTPSGGTPVTSAAPPPAARAKPRPRPAARPGPKAAPRPRPEPVSDAPVESAAAADQPAPAGANTPPEGVSIPPARPRQQSARPAGRPGPSTPRPTGPTPGTPATPSRQRLAGPRPARPAGEPPGTPNRPNWAWPGGGQQRDQRTGRVVPEAKGEPLLDRLRNMVKGAGGRPPSGSDSSDDAVTVEQVSAREAIAAVRRGPRIGGRSIRRPRFPSFGRARPSLPPSRQLPAGSRNPRTPPGDESSS